MKAIFHLIEHDFRNFFRYKWWLAGLISMNLADLLIMAVVYNQMLSPEIAEQRRHGCWLICLGFHDWSRD